MNNAQTLLKKHFGYEHFRTGQEEIINHILNKEDCLSIMPTGAGKSICYQIPAMMLSGTTIVVSPLISLMKDQVDGLNQIGIPAAFINSSLSNTEYIQTIENASNGIYKIIYVAPERLESDTFFNLLNRLEISLFAIDEAHCVSRWGHDFRPSYQQIANIILNLKTRPVVAAFTATATEIVKQDIIDLLHLSNPFILTTGFDRKNLHFSVQNMTDKKKFILDYIENHQNQSGIIYCATRKNVDTLYDNLQNIGVLVSKYHAGMTERQRTENQDDFVYDRTNVMIATNAFGMGIDKSNIRYIIHFNMPRDIESYYQEAGRSGRDGDEADCILLFNRSDIVTNKFLIEQGSPNIDHSKEYQKLNDMVDYCNTDKCLRKYILEYFGETTTFENCQNCSNCESDIQVTNITTDAKKILSCIKRMHERYGIGLVTDVLKGSRSSKIKSLNFDNLSTYGIMYEYSKNTIKDLISFLITENYIRCVGDKYPILVLTPLSNDVLFKDKKVTIKRKIEKVQKVERIEKPYDKNLFELLSNLRKEVANKCAVPPFIVFTDVSLKQMSTDYPITVESMLKIEGVGKYKIERYGEVFISAISDYVKSNNIQIPEEVSKLKKEIKPKEDTKMITYELYTSGKTIEDIANIRKLTKQTIQNHLLACYEMGMEIDIEKEIHVEYAEQIKNAIQKYGTEKLKPLKEALPEEVSYLDIRYYILLGNKKSS